MNRMKSESRAMMGLVRYWATLALAMLLVGCGSGSDSEDAANERPSAEAGADQSVVAGATVTLRGTGSDTDGTIASYSWTRTSGPAVSMSTADQATASFVAPGVAANTALVFRLTVTDDEGATASDTVTVTVTPAPNQPPSAQAGADQSVVAGATVTLRGTGSDTDGTIERYSWTQTSGPAVALTTTDRATASFTAPSVGANTALVFRLAVTDDDAATGSDTVTVTVSPAVTPNVPPSAQAGADQSVVAGATVTLRGTGSDTDGTIEGYSWTRISGPSVALSGASQATASFTAPSVGANTALVFRLAVTDDDGATGSDTVTVTVSPAPNQPPIASISNVATINERSTISLDGSSSRDPDGTISSYLWSLEAVEDGVSVSLTNVSSITATLAVGELVEDAAVTIKLVVIDDDSSSSEASIMVSLQEIDAGLLPPDPDSSGLATLEGVDFDRNGVRDDVEVVIYELHKDSMENREVLKVGSMALQSALMATMTATEEDNDSASESVAKFAYCLREMSGMNRRKQLAILKSLVINTPERKAAYDAYNQSRVGTIQRLVSATPAECMSLESQ